MKKIFLTVLTLLFVTSAAFAATKADALKFFNYYITSANSYNPVITTLYDPNAKIIREVIKKDGTVVPRQATTARYISEMKKGQCIAKMRNYKNYYSNIKVQQLSSNTFKITALRQPTGETYKLKTYMVIKQKSNGSWIITEEMMQSKVQLLLYAK